MSRTARKRDAQKSRRKIVLAARAEFAAKGYAGARMEQIADRAEVKKELIYHYFRGKEHLFEEVRAKQLAVVEQRHEIPHNPLLDDSHSAAEMFAWRFRRMLGDVEWVKLLTGKPCRPRWRRLPTRRHGERQSKVLSTSSKRRKGTDASLPT